MLNGHNGKDYFLNGADIEQEEGADESSWSFLTDVQDHQILMHRDAHFGGSFAVMLEYYESDGLGVIEEFDLDRIRYLALMEAETNQNLAALLLTPDEVARVAAARQAYRQLKAVYEVKDKVATAHLIADLVLSEEEEPTAQVEAIMEAGSIMVTPLLQIIKNPQAYDELFPGYGFAPFLAIVTLGKLKSEEAIAPIFETLSRETHFGDEGILEALRDIGLPAQQFLMKRLKARPFTKDNLQAAYALSAFADESQVGLAALDELKEESNWSKRLYCSYLISICLCLKDSQYWRSFIDFAQNPKLPEPLHDELSEVIGPLS